MGMKLSPLLNWFLRLSLIFPVVKGVCVPIDLQEIYEKEASFLPHLEAEETPLSFKEELSVSLSLPDFEAAPCTFRFHPTLLTLIFTEEAQREKQTLVKERSFSQEDAASLAQNYENKAVEISHPLADHPIDPNLEKRPLEKVDFLSHASSDTPEETISSVSPLPEAFQMKETPLIQKPFSPKKGEAKASSIASLPNYSSTFETHSTQPSRRETEFVPTHEAGAKWCFDRDAFHYYIDHPPPKSRSLAFDPINPSLKSMREVDLICPKGTLLISTHFTENYLSTLSWSDLSQLSEKQDDIQFFPTPETVSKAPTLGEHLFVLNDQETTTCLAPFLIEKEVDLPIQKDRFYPPHATLTSPPLDPLTFHSSPYLNIDDSQAHVSAYSYYPSKERSTPLPPCYNLSKGPTFAMDINRHTYTFHSLPGFELYTSEAAVEFPKRIQDFQKSALALIHPELSLPSPLEKDREETIPSLENHSLALSQTDLALALPSPELKEKPFELEEKSEDYPLLSHKAPFPKKGGEFLAKELDLTPPHLAATSKPIPSDQNLFSPKHEREKISLPPSFPYFLPPQTTNSAPPLDHETALSLRLTEKDLIYGKTPSPERPITPWEELPLPGMDDKELSPVIERKQPEKLIEDLPNLYALSPLLQAKHPAIETPAFPIEEGIDLNLHQKEYSLPPSPSFYPPRVPSLSNEESTISLQEKQIETLRGKVLLDGIEEGDILLPHVAGKKVSPEKEILTPHNAFDALPSAETMVELAQRTPAFPNIRGLMENSPVPSKIKTELEVAIAEVDEIETRMIHSQSKEILEDFEQENQASSGAIALAIPPLQEKPNHEETKTLNQSSRFTNAFLTEIPPPSHLNTVTYHNEFETSVHYTKREDGKGYQFAIKMQPREDFHFSSPHQNFIFVIDGSSSIQKHRYATFKEGVARAIGYLQEGDTFNIIVADAKVTPLSKKSLSYNRKSVREAQHFLEENKYRGFFINYNAFDLLADVSDYFDPNRENIVVLLTDGHSFKTIQEHKEDFQELASASKGRFSIYTATASQGNNLSMLDLVSTFNSGELMYSKTNAAFSRQLARLVKHVEHVVAKDIRIEPTMAQRDSGIAFYPSHESLPALYSDKPYTIYGTIDELKDFDLILQGKCGDEWINIKQHITFKHATKATESIKRGFAMQQAYVCYSYFLQDENPFFLHEAERILSPHHLPTAVR